MTQDADTFRRWVHPDAFDMAMAQRDAARRQVKKLTAEVRRLQRQLDGCRVCEQDGREFCTLHNDGSPGGSDA